MKKIIAYFLFFMQKIIFNRAVFYSSYIYGINQKKWIIIKLPKISAF